MDIITALGRTIPFAFASGINLYATIAVMGLSSRFGLVDLPDQFRAFDHPVVIAGAIALYVIEFFADKIPWVDSLWDAVHTIVRPVGGALVAVTALGHATPAAQGLIAALGGSVALATHLTRPGLERSQTQARNLSATGCSASSRTYSRSAFPTSH
jgi:hypothetical protein